MGVVSGRFGLGTARYVGLAGAVALAVAAYVGGALPHRDPAPTVAAAWTRAPLALVAWLVGTGLLVLAWSLAGRLRPTLRWVLTTAALWCAPLALAPPLGSRDVYAYACQGAVYAAGLDPYAVGAAALPCPWLDSISLIWRETPAPYGPLYIGFAAAAVAISGGHLWVAVGLLRLVAVAGVLLAAAYLPRLARASGVDGSRAAWLGLAAPLVGVHLVSAAHNDALMIGLVLAGLVYAARRRPVLAGALFGAALAVKATAGIALPFAVLLAVRPERRLPALARAAGWVGLGCVAAYGAVAAVTGLGFGWVTGLRHSGDSVQWTSLPTGVGIAVGYIGHADTAIAVARTVGLAVLLVVLVVLWWRARGRDTREVVHAAGLALLATTLLAPVFHPWYWLLPLAVLAAAGAEWRWLVPVTAALSFLVLPDGYNLARATRAPGALAVLAVALLTVWLAVRKFPLKTHDPGGRLLP